MATQIDNEGPTLGVEAKLWVAVHKLHTTASSAQSTTC